jgi:hypothetical protein
MRRQGARRFLAALGMTSAAGMASGASGGDFHVITASVHNFVSKEQQWYKNIFNMQKYFFQRAKFKEKKRLLRFYIDGIALTAIHNKALDCLRCALDCLRRTPLRSGCFATLAMTQSVQWREACGGCAIP